MEIDKTTLNDLVIFDREDEFSVFNKINFTLTTRGKQQLRKNLGAPLNDAETIRGIQQTISAIKNKLAQWPVLISNGTIMVVERFYEAQIDPIPAKPSFTTTFSYKLFHGHDFSLVKYSVKHAFDFIKGMQEMINLFSGADVPSVLKKQIEEARKLLDNEEFSIITQNKTAAHLTGNKMLELAHFILYKYKRKIHELMDIFGRMDAWYGMAVAMQRFDLAVPEFLDSKEPVIQAEALYHIMLQQPVPYNLKMNKDTNFLFLTGANMAGKSTFIKACGTAVYLAHTGMGVPAKNMKLTYFDGMLSNINVIDNIAKGESYFFNEVQRIKATVSKISDGKKWLILIDELFKGTNVQDAMKCSSTVIEGLLKIKNSLFILSTHLYEIGEELKKHPNISFNYFETSVTDDQLSFSYQLKDGISNDRLGYLILKKEGVVKMLEDL
jgi:DNA mismatch repair protein MutS